MSSITNVQTYRCSVIISWSGWLLFTAIKHFVDILLLVVFYITGCRRERSTEWSKNTASRLQRCNEWVSIWRTSFCWLLHESSTKSLWPISNLEEKLNSMLAWWLMQDRRSFCTTLLGILDVVDQYQSLTPNLLNHKRLSHHPSVGGINIWLFAAKREESNNSKILPVDWRGATIVRIFGAPSTSLNNFWWSI